MANPLLALAGRREPAPRAPIDMPMPPPPRNGPPGGPPPGAPPMPAAGPGAGAPPANMTPDQAVKVLTSFGIKPGDVPVVLAALTTIERASTQGGMAPPGAEGKPPADEGDDNDEPDAGDDDTSDEEEPDEE